MAFCNKNRYDEVYAGISLNKIYDEVEKVASVLIENNKNYKAKIRQILQKHHTNVSRGIWSL